MGTEVSHSGMLQEISRIISAPGSPYVKLDVVIHCGGNDIVPRQVLRWDIGRDYPKAYMDSASVVVTLGAGTLMTLIAPFQDDIKLTINITPLNEEGKPITSEKVESHTYRAYLADDVPKTLDQHSNPSMQSQEVGDLTQLKDVAFALEEVAIEQLRKMAVGTIPRFATPFSVMKTFFVRAKEQLRLGQDVMITDVDMVEPNNTTPRDHIVLRDGTPLLDLPDILQNEQGGIYSTCLGFYIQDRKIYAWPLYDFNRIKTARRVLQIFLSPTRQAIMIDRTWEDHGREVAIFSAGISKVIDDSQGDLNRHGNAVRFTDAGKLLDNFGTVKGNKLVVNRGEQNSEFATTVMGNGQNYAKLADNKVTSNVYLEASKIARRAGALMVVPWQRSKPSLLTPGMAVELFYDYKGQVRSIEGTLIGSYSSYQMEGQGPIARAYRCGTSIIVFVDRSDPDYVAYMQAGGTISPNPEIGPF